MKNKSYSQSPLCRRPLQKGFTLLETCIALFVLVVCILPIVTLVLAARNLDQQAQMQTVAYEIAWKELETLRSLPLANRLVTPQTAFSIPTAIEQAYPSPAFTGAYSISNVAGIGDTTFGVQQIAVGVSWHNQSGSTAQSSVRVSTNITGGAGN